ncbi:hypothetical protein IU436_29320 [Nocardia farcinica]|uniref:hypothetical protein n=1 Tax=Nocardia farcinica TaxID=37329 RepID=UPI001894EC2C|nr:hypothetical protein [Nocardia farcinica]MBF6422726.1 hypothetical protein [Nocardia farcinica]MBF6434424.1 hypothetical protein [Nocardia farcinica]MBF6505509.1 hypothetical protein [Nocardia farcinica]
MSNTPTYLTIATLVMGSSVLGGLMTAAITGMRDAASKRREGYAAAVKALVARAEYPYRVRRRPDDEPATLAELAKLGHDIQEQIAAARIWIQTENSRVAAIFIDCLRKIDTRVGPAASEAWQQPPISRANEMVLAGWGPGSQDEHICRFGEAVRWRFGWRRLIPRRPSTREINAA